MKTASDWQQESSPLDPTSLVMLLDEVSAMTAARRPLATALADLDDASMGKVGRAARVVRSRVNQGQSPIDAIAQLSPRYGSAIRVAFEVVSETGSTWAIDQVIETIREETQAKRDFWLASINPMINIVVATVVLFLVIPQILVAVAESKPIKDASAPSSSEIYEKFANDFALSVAATVIGIGVFGGFLYWGLNRSHRRVDQLLNQGSFCRWMAFMLGSSADLAKSIGAASTAVSASFAESWDGTVQAVRAGAMSASAMSIPEKTPEVVQQCIVDLASDQRDGEQIAEDLRGLSVLYRQQSLRYRRWWAEFVPKLISSIVILVMMFVLAKTIIQPMLDMTSKITR